MFRLVSGNLGRGVCARTFRVYKVFTKTGRGPWLREDSALGLPVFKLYSTICTVLLPGMHAYNRPARGYLLVWEKDVRGRAQGWAGWTADWMVSVSVRWLVCGKSRVLGGCKEPSDRGNPMFTLPDWVPQGQMVSWTMVSTPWPSCWPPPSTQLYAWSSE